MSADFKVYCNNNLLIPQAKNFCQKHQFVFTDKISASESLYLNYNDFLPKLIDPAKKLELQIDFTQGAISHRLQFGGGQGQTIAKAIGISSKQKPSVIDATAGLARDALVLAKLGCSMLLLEQSPILVEMLTQALKQAQLNEQFNMLIPSPFEIIQTNAIDYLQQHPASTDVVYIDPMYPERKKSALVKKDMQLLHQLIGHATEEENGTLLAAALQAASQRVVVKRPKGAEQLPGPQPTMALQSKKTRYDVYVINALKK